MTLVRRVVLILVLVVVGVLSVAGSAATLTTQGAGSQAPRSSRTIIKYVTVAGTSYAVVNVPTVIGLLSSSPYVKFVARIVNLCHGAGFWGFVSPSRLQFGLVGWVPSSLRACLSQPPQVNGGPGASEPCAQFFTTPNAAYYVLVLGTTGICPNLSTEVPGGWPAQTNASIAGLPAGSNVLVKCQTFSGGYLWDYVAPPVSLAALPASRNAYWINDSYVPTGYSWLPDVPHCSGFASTW